MKKNIVFIALVFLIISVISCKKKEMETYLPSIGDIAPDFTLKDMNGNALTLTDYKGKTVMIEFWATWCPPCKELIPTLEVLYKKYRGKGFIILALVSEDEGKETIKSFIKEYEITYPVLLANKETIKRYGISSIPVSFIINKEGRIVNRHLGNTPDLMQELTADIERLL